MQCDRAQCDGGVHRFGGGSSFVARCVAKIVGRKAREIAENNKVCAVFAWLDLERQLRIEGIAEKVSAAESLRYFLSRPFGSRLGAWVSRQSSVISSRSLLEMQFEKMKEKFKNGEVPLPDFWGGYRIVPNAFEFWQGRQNRLHDRFEYVKKSDSNSPAVWEISRLSP